MDASIGNEGEFSRSGRRLVNELKSCDHAGWFTQFYRNQGQFDLSFDLEM
jgi:hypothetical protein